MKKIVMVGILLSSLLITACQSGEVKEKGESTMNTTKVDAFGDYKVTDMNGKVVKMSDYKGKKVYIKFWASWCPICLSGLKEVDKLANEDNDFVVLTIVAPGQNGEMKESEFKEWFEMLDNVKITVLFDDNANYTLSMGVRGYPSSAFYDSKGELVKFQPGQIDNKLIKETMNSIK